MSTIEIAISIFASLSTQWDKCYNYKSFYNWNWDITIIVSVKRLTHTSGQGKEKYELEITFKILLEMDIH